jgi:membrane associated rhomboid family serine protease
MFFFFLPVGMNYRTQRLPIVTLSLIGLNTLVYLVSLMFAVATHGQSNLWIYEHLWLIPADWHWYASFTSMFVHGGLFHLLGNMIFLFLFGCCVEDMIGRTRFAGFYLLGGLVAEMVFIAMAPKHFLTPNPMGGASGAISACMGMYLLLRTRADIEFKYVYLFFLRFGAGEFSVPAWVVIPFWFLKNLFWAVLGMRATGISGGVAFGDHVGGFLAGFAAIGIYKLAGKPHVVEATGQAEDDDDEKLPTQPPRAGKRPPMRIHLRPAPVAVVTETPTIFLHDGIAQSGPFTLSQVQAMLHAGGVHPGTQYWSEGLDDWQDIADLSDQPGG